VAVIAEGANLWDVTLETFEHYMAKAGRKFFVRAFQKVYYDSFVWMATYWLGVPVAKNPLDLWVYQEIIWETRPQVLIETGSYEGGSALFFASLFDLIGEGRVVTIDIEDTAARHLSHPRITSIVGSSVSDDVVYQLRKIVGNQTAMVSLDSDHSAKHVLREMELYSQFVSTGNYIVVEDTELKGPGPGKAVTRFLKDRKDFVQDRSREKFMVTSNRGGFLKRVQNKPNF